MAEVTEAPKKTEVTQGQGSEVKVAHPAATLMPWTESTFALMCRFSEEMDRLFEDFGFGRRLQTAFGRGRELFGARSDSFRPNGRRGSTFSSVAATTSSAPTCRG